MKKRLLLSFASVLMMSFGAFAQQEDDFVNQFNDFALKVNSEYQDFRAKSNDDFVASLISAWKFYQAGPVIEAPKEKTVPPVVYDRNKDGKKKGKIITTPDKDIVTAPVITPVTEPVSPVIEVPVEQKPFEFQYQTTSFSVRCSPAMKINILSLDKKSVSAAWEKLAVKENDNTLSDCLAIRDKYNLCDWAYLNMLNALALKYQNGKTEATLMTAYLFSQSGYKMRLGISDTKLYLLYGTQHQVFGVPYYTIDGSMFYPIEGKVEGMSICDFSFPNEKDLSLVITKEPSFAYKKSELRTLKSKRYGVTATCYENINLIDFYGRYPSSQLGSNPMTRWALYATTPVEKAVKETLYPALQQAVAGKDKAAATDILLDFVQTAFTYKYDDEVWGTDRAFFAEETLYYPYCDCEDRSILFSHLVRDILGLDVVLVYYPGHLATAVNLPEGTKGDCYVVGGRNFTVCDPTYIGASVGKSMPNVNVNNAKVILLK